VVEQLENDLMGQRHVLTNHGNLAGE